MCGITGIFDAAGLGGSRAALRAANDIAAYRGPDSAGYALFDFCGPAPQAHFSPHLPAEDVLPAATLGLGHRRLAIIDLSDAGHQPMASADRMLWVTYNGEIYNYLELRQELETLGCTFRSHSDTEVILAAYQTWGDECVARFNGMWAFALADLRQRRLFCSRDRYGIKPFHYWQGEGRFVFGSEIKQLLQFPLVRRQVNDRAVYEFLAFQAVEYDDETFFAGVRKLLHGHNLTLDLSSGQVQTKAWYSPAFEIDRRITRPAAAEEFHRLLADSVRLQLRSDVEVGSCLSGGLDSTSLVCLMNRQLRDAGRQHVQRTFSSHFDDEEANELTYMQEVIRATGVRADFTHPQPADFLADMERMVWHQEEPFGSTSIFAQWSVFKLVGQHGIKVMLDGQGADEQLAGYVSLSPYYLQELNAKKQKVRLAWERLLDPRWRSQPWWRRTQTVASDLWRRLPGQRKPSPAPPPDWIRVDLAARFDGHCHYPLNQQVRPFGEEEHLNNVLYQLTFHNNLQSLLKYEDRNSMAFSVESRVPFLDHRLTEFLFTLPSSFKIRDGYTKRVMRDGMAGVIPERIRNRVAKLGFATPDRAWRKTILRPLVEQALASERLARYLDPPRALAWFDYVVKNNLPDSAPWRWVNLALWEKAYELC